MQAMAGRSNKYADRYHANLTRLASTHSFFSTLLSQLEKGKKGLDDRESEPRDNLNICNPYDSAEDEQNAHEIFDRKLDDVTYTPNSVGVINPSDEYQAIHRHRMDILTTALHLYAQKRKLGITRYHNKLANIS